MTVIPTLHTLANRVYANRVLPEIERQKEEELRELINSDISKQNAAIDLKASLYYMAFFFGLSLGSVFPNIRALLGITSVLSLLKAMKVASSKQKPCRGVVYRITGLPQPVKSQTLISESETNKFMEAMHRDSKEKLATYNSICFIQDAITGDVTVCKTKDQPAHVLFPRSDL